MSACSGASPPDTVYLTTTTWAHNPLEKPRQRARSASRRSPLAGPLREEEGLSKEEKKARAKAEREARKARKAAKRDAAADDATVEEPSRRDRKIYTHRSEATTVRRGEGGSKRKGHYAACSSRSGPDGASASLPAADAAGRTCGRPCAATRRTVFLHDVCVRWCRGWG